MTKSGLAWVPPAALWLGGLALVAGPTARPLSAQTAPRIVWSTSTWEDVPIVYVSGAVALPDGTFLVSDAAGARVYRLDPGSERWSIQYDGGDGPREVKTPTLFTSKGDSIALYDVGQQAINVYDGSLDLARRIHLTQWVSSPKGLAWLEDGSFVLTGGMFSSRFMVHRFSEAGRLLRSWRPVPEDLRRNAGIHVAGGPVTATGGSVLYSEALQHWIGQIDPEGGARMVASDTAATVRVTEDNFFKPLDLDGETVMAPQWWHDQSTGVFRLANGEILNVIAREYSNSTTWQVFSEEGELLSEVLSPEGYIVWDRTDGQFLVSYRDDLTDEWHFAVLEWMYGGLP